MTRGLSTAGLGKPKYNLAIEQHDAYIKALIVSGLEVTIMDKDNNFPDSTFIEDTAICTPYCAIIMRPGAESRRGEISAVRKVLSDFYENIECIKEPGTLDGGDVLMIGSQYYIGKSSRTNEIGAKQLIQILENYELSGSLVEDFDLLHLKSGCSYLEHNTMLAGPELFNNEVFAGLNIILVQREEYLGANSLWINGTVLVPKGNPDTTKQIEKNGYKIIELDVSEFQKLDGGLSCLSLRF